MIGTESHRMYRGLKAFVLAGVLAGLLAGADRSFATDAIPTCLAGNSALPIDNAAVLKLKTSTPNQFLARAYVAGTVAQIYPDRNDHDHFSIQIGPEPTDTIEVVYNVHFGKLPDLKTGMTIQACGDFINSFAPTPQYQPSPDGAIIHWVHRNPKPRGHASGFVVVEGELHGQGNGRRR